MENNFFPIFFIMHTHAQNVLLDIVIFTHQFFIRPITQFLTVASG